jgi:tetratricopeptide (TPR) repeat protein
MYPHQVSGSLTFSLGRFRCDVDCEEYLARYIKSDKSGVLLGNDERVSSSLSLSLDAIKTENLAAWEALRMLAWLGPDQITKQLLRSLLHAKVDQAHAEDEAAALACAEAAAIALNASSATPLLAIGGLAFCTLLSSGRQALHSRRHGARFLMSLIVVISTGTALSIQAKLRQMSASSAFHTSSFQEAAGAYHPLRRINSGGVFEKTDQIWNILKSFSLLVVKEGRGSIHRLQAQALRLSQDKQDSQRNLQICLRALLKAWTFKPELVDTWQGSATILEHVKAVVAHSVERTERNDISRLDTAVLSREAGVYSAMALNRFEEAQDSLELSLTILNDMRGSNPRIPSARASAHHELGRVLRYEGQFLQSEESLHKALEIRNSLAQNDPNARHEVAATLHELGVLEVKKHNLDSAANNLQQALALRRTLERDSPREDMEAACSSTLHQLAAVHLARKPPALDIAESLLNEALSLNMQIGQRAATLKQLARVSIRWGQFDTAERRLGQALELYSELYGESTLHINVAAVRFQQGALAFQREQLEQAWVHFSECLRARKFVYAYLQGIHVEVSSVFHELGCVAMAQKRFEKACEMLQSEKEILDQLCEASSHQLDRLLQARLTNLTWLRKCAKDQGDDEKAREIACQRSNLKRQATTAEPAPCTPQPTQVNLLQQEALRCRIVARQFALADSRNMGAAADRLTSGLASLWKEVERSADSKSKLYEAVVDFHSTVSESMEDPNTGSCIFEACDHLRDVLRDQGLKINDAFSRKAK